MSYVWYVSYGSNMASARLACYVRVAAAGGHAGNPGARDRRLPSGSIPSTCRAPSLRRRVAAVGRRGGVLRPHEPGFTAARGYLVTAEQFADIAAQEMYRAPHAGNPLEAVVADRSTAAGTRWDRDATRRSSRSVGTTNRRC